MKDVQQEQRREVVFMAGEGRQVAAPEKYQREEELIRGNIFTVKESGQRTHYEMAEIHENEESVLVDVRPIKPQPWKSLILTGTLIAGWFIFQTLGGWIFG